MLTKHELPVAKEETERVDTLRYSWQKLCSQQSEISTHLIMIQPDFKGDLISDVKTFLDDCNNFYNDYRTVSYIFIIV